MKKTRSFTLHNKKYEPSKKAGQQASFSTILGCIIFPVDEYL